MTKGCKDPDGLSVKQARFAALVAQGSTYSDAYRATHPRSRVKGNSLYVEASKLAALPNVRRRLNELLSQAKVEDMISAPRMLEWLWRGLEASFNAENFTAFANLLRQGNQIVGILKNELIVSGEKALTDQELIERMAGGDKKRARMLKSIFGGKPGKTETTPENEEDVTSPATIDEVNH